MTTQECNVRDSRIVAKIESVLRVHQQLQQYAAVLQVSIENAVIVLRGELPSNSLKSQLVPAVRQAGVLARVDDCVQVRR
jgi:hypothetical protein